jgi:hypothetical protein
MMRRYGASSLHLLGHVVLIAVAGYALSRAFQPRFAPEPLNLAAWLAGGAVIHDLLLLPAYSLADAAGRRLLPGALLNHVRIPVALSGVVFLVYAPRIVDRQPQNVVNALGEPPPDYLARWVLLTVGLFGASALMYAFRAARAARRRRTAA